MICSPCRRAGQLNTEANELLALGSPANNVIYLTRKTHKDCRGGTWCDCQHVVGHALNELAIAQLNNEPKPDLEESPIMVDDVSASE